MTNIKSIQKSVFYLSFPLTFVGIIFPIKAIEYGANSIQLGVIFAVLSMIAILANPIIGGFVDKQGYKVSLICGSIIYIGALIILHFCNSYTELLLASVISSFSASFIGIACDAFVIANSRENNISENFANLQQWGARGGFIGVFIGLNVMSNSLLGGSKFVFLIFIAFMLISIFYTQRNLPAYAEKNKVDKQEEKKSIFQVKELRRLNGKIKLFLVIVFISAIDGGTLSPVFLTYLKEKVTSNLYNVTYLYLPAAILTMILPVYLGRMISKYNKAILVIGSLILEIACWIYFARVTDFNILTILFTFMSVIGLIFGLVWSSIKKSVFENEQIGYKAGLAKLAGGLGGGLGAILGGWIYNYWGINVVIAFKISISLVIVILFIILFRNYKVNVKVYEDISTNY